MAASEKKRTSRSSRGFVLLVVLATLGLLSASVVSFTQITRSHVKVIAALSESARAEALADAGVNIAILELVSAREKEPPARRFMPDGSPFACRIGDAGRLLISVRDEAGKVDLNIGSEPLLRALILGLGGGEPMVDAILDYRDADNDRRASGAEAPEYRAAGRPAGPRNGAFLAIEELSGVLGVTQADAERLAPFLTIHSGLMGLDTSVAPKTLLDVIAQGIQRGGASTFSDDPADLPNTETEKALVAPLPRPFLSASTQRAFAVRSEAASATGAVFVRETLVEFLAPSTSTYVLRRWRRGAASGLSVAAGPLPPC